jgi:hypothetical protein
MAGLHGGFSVSDDVRKRIAELETSSLESGGKERERAGIHFRRAWGAWGVICGGWVEGAAQGSPGELLDAGK